jgi:hypothetical protein
MRFLIKKPTIKKMESQERSQKVVKIKAFQKSKGIGITIKEAMKKPAISGAPKSDW